MMPCMAGSAMVPRATSGVSSKATMPLFTNAIAPNATMVMERPSSTAVRSPRRFRIGRHADHPRPPAETGLAEIGPDRRVHEECDAVDQPHDQQFADAGQGSDMGQRPQRIGAAPFKPAADAVGHGFGQGEVAKRQVGGGKGGGGVKWRSGTEFGQQPTHQGPKHKAHAKGRADQAEVRGLFVRLGNVRHVGGGGGLGGCGDAADDTPPPAAARSCPPLPSPDSPAS